MMKYEFEKLAGRSVTEYQYIAIDILYMSSSLEKTEFVKSIRHILNSIPETKKEKRHKNNVSER